MTTSDMIFEFRLRMDKADTAFPTGFQDDEIIPFLNDAQLQLVKQSYRSFEANQNITDKLRDLSKFSNYVIVDSDWNADKGCYILSIENVAPENYLHSLSQQLQIENKKCGKPFLKAVMQIQIDDLPLLMSDPFNRPNASRPVSLFSDSFIELYISSNSTPLDLASNYSLTFKHRYLKMPTKIDIGFDCQLPDFTHTEIVNIAVWKAAEYTNNERVSTIPPVHILPQE